MASISIVITNAGLNLFRDGGSNADTPIISFVAFGTSSATPTTGDTQLGNEVFRKAVSTLTNGLNPGELLVTTNLGPADAAGISIQEVGFIGGSTATSSPNTGVLIAHGLWSHTKTNQESIPVQLDLTF